MRFEHHGPGQPFPAESGRQIARDVFKKWVGGCFFLRVRPGNLKFRPVSRVIRFERRVVRLEQPAVRLEQLAVRVESLVVQLESPVVQVEQPVERSELFKIHLDHPVHRQRRSSCPFVPFRGVRR